MKRTTFLFLKFFSDIFSFIILIVGIISIYHFVTDYDFGGRLFMLSEKGFFNDASSQARLDVFDFRIRKAIFFYSLILILFSSILDFTDKSMRVEFIDVGQGDSILLRTNNGNYLIDTGGNIFGDFDVGYLLLILTRIIAKAFLFLWKIWT